MWKPSCITRHLSVFKYTPRDALYGSIESCTPEDYEFLKSFLSEPLGFELDSSSDDTIDRLLDREMKPIGISLLLRKIIVATSNNDDDDLVFSDSWVTRIIIQSSGYLEPISPLYKSVMDLFSLCELFEILCWLSFGARDLFQSTQADEVKLKLDAISSVQILISERRSIISDP